jgi:prepilin peptidase CpaA
MLGASGGTPDALRAGKRRTVAQNIALHARSIPMMSGTLLLQSVTAALLAFAALHDVATRTVPNWVSVAVLAFGITLQAIAGSLLAATGLSLLVFLLATAMWLRGWMGGADVKLLGAAAIAVTPGTIGSLLIDVSLAGGVLALVYLALSRLVHRPQPGPCKHFLKRLIKAELWRIHHRAPLPYAVAIAIGAVLTLFPS